MRNSDNTPRGNTKKFLYTGPKREEQPEDQWIFTPRKNESPRARPQFDMEDVWSIKKNVSISGGKSKQGSDGLNLKANTTYYSRYGGIGEKNDGGNYGSTSKGANNQGVSNQTWNSNYTNKSFSYSSNNFQTPRSSQQMPNSRSNSQAFSPYSNNDSSLW